ncbi:MAG TPA: YceI family protein [Ohtaekwangia sp.]|uniref:YceI family protein n=1 Tax=Ohtaekwangia sp. TaxID=2066019 RepID=UPI002F92EB87
MKQLLAAMAILLAGSALSPEKIISYTVDLKQSSVRWTGYYTFSFGEHYGTMRLSTGELAFDNGQLTEGRFTLDMNSIQDEDMAGEQSAHDLINHLKSDDFFSTEKFPLATFEIRKVIPIKDAAANQPNYEIIGTLTLKGTSNALTFPALITSQGNTVKAHAKFKFDRTKWNVRFNSGKFFSDIGDGAISDAIGIELDLLATL